MTTAFLNYKRFEVLDACGAQQCQRAILPFSITAFFRPIHRFSSILSFFIDSSVAGAFRIRRIHSLQTPSDVAVIIQKCRQTTSTISFWHMQPRGSREISKHACYIVVPVHYQLSPLERTALTAFIAER